VHVFPLVGFTGAILHTGEEWWAIGSGHSALGWVSAAVSLVPDPRIDPREHWGRVFRSLVTPWYDLLFATILDIEQERYPLFFGAGNLNLSGFWEKFEDCSIRLTPGNLKLAAPYQDGEETAMAYVRDTRWVAASRSEANSHLIRGGWALIDEERMGPRGPDGET